MRILLFTGKGGVGKTTVAAATALKAARSGIRTLVMSTDPAHSLADSFDRELGGEPTELEKNLHGQQIDAQARLEEGWRDIQEYVLSLLDWGGVDAVAAEELSVIPGLDEIFSLTDVKRAASSGDYDLLVVDCAPTAETLRLLSLPDAMNWYIERIFPVERRIVKAVRPLLTRVTSMPIADDKIFAAIARLHAELDSVHKLLIDTSISTVRLVVNAERMVIAEARRTYTYLNLFGYRVDAVICNRLIPEQVSDPYFRQWKQIQKEHLGEIVESFSPVPIMQVPLYEQEMVGIEMLDRLGTELYAGLDPAGIFHENEPMQVTKKGTGYTLSLHLPFAGKDDLDLLRKGDDLYVKVGQYKRTFMLPSVLLRHDITSAAFEGDRLVITFARGRAAAAKGGE
ncbi:MAG TPA: TRC40/GET3/ArsA family transport-energizing ATPase [Actinomycetota bacterium]|nr:TRC40/GET3/ArsA family transport-energizing ATPase [Actinomycetota bacterium]